MNELKELFARVARDRARTPLIYAPSEGRVLTAGDLEDEARETVALLGHAGIAPGQLVISTVGNRSAFLSLLLACLESGVPLMPLDRSTPLVEALDLARQFAAAAIVTPEPIPASGTARHSEVTLPGGLSLVRFVDVDAPNVPRYAGAAIIKLTSGSSGGPKAIATTLPQLLGDSRRIVTAMNIAPGDTQLGVIPLSHAYGLGNIAVPLLTQGTAVVLRERFMPSLVAADAARAGARIFAAVPFMVEHLVAHLPSSEWPRALKRVVSAGARLDGHTIERFKARFGVKVHAFYGASETGGIAFDADDEIGDIATVGYPLPGVSVSLVSHEDAPSGSGRIHVKSDAVSAGYVGPTSAEEDGFCQGGFLTGDLGSFDEAGRLVLTGRVSSFINVAGRKVHPDEVERVLRTMPGVADARVLAAPDTHRGQQLVACVAASSPLKVIAIRQFCAERLASHKIPREFIFVDALPHDARGKISRHALAALVSEHLATIHQSARRSQAGQAGDEAVAGGPSETTERSSR